MRVEKNRKKKKKLVDRNVFYLRKQTISGYYLGYFLIPTIESLFASENAECATSSLYICLRLRRRRLPHNAGEINR